MPSPPPPPVAPMLTLRARAHEAVATLREVALMARDIAPVLPDASDEDDIVVLVHGFLASAGVFRPLRARIEREAGAHVASFTHAPGAGVKSIAGALAALVDRLPPRARVHVVGHSLGGLVARWYVQELGGHARVAQTISLASPFGGTPLANRFPILVGRDLRPGSPLLRRLRARAQVHGVPHLSVAGASDTLVSQEAALAFPEGRRVVLPQRGHNTLLYDNMVADIVVRAVRTAAQQ